MFDLGNLTESGGGGSRDYASPTQEVARHDVLPQGRGEWEVHTVTKGWAPLALALQPALDAALVASPRVERVEILLDPTAKSWVAEPDSVSDNVRRRCTVYVVFPLEQKMGKVGGESPRPLRWRPHGGLKDINDNAPSICPGVYASCTADPVTPHPDEPVSARSQPPSDFPSEKKIDDDPLMFTANPVDGFVIHTGVFERLQHGISERYAGHRYVGQV